MMDLQRQKVRNMVDPYGTKDTILDYMAVRQRHKEKYLGILMVVLKSKVYLTNLN